MKRTLTWTVACVLVLLAGRASAQEPTFGDAGHVAISAERLFGYVHASRTQTVAGVETTASQDYFTLLTNPIGALSGYGWPRIGIDAFVINGLSVGGALGFFYLSDDDEDSATGFLLAPRIGYALAVAPTRVDLAEGRGDLLAHLEQSKRHRHRHELVGCRRHGRGAHHDPARPARRLHDRPDGRHRCRREHIRVGRRYVGQRRPEYTDIGGHAGLLLFL